MKIACLLFDKELKDVLLVSRDRARSDIPTFVARQASQVMEQASAFMARQFGLAVPDSRFREVMRITKGNVETVYVTASIEQETVKACRWFASGFIMNYTSSARLLYGDGVIPYAVQSARTLLKAFQ